MSYKILRNQFLNYFQKNGHAIEASSSLVPAEDPTLLYTNAGMNQFKNAFLGIEKPISSQIVTAQRCVRAGGKHNDLENVGYTARHHTFFEMLGNFSFGAYFKKGAIDLAWKFVTQELQLPLSRLWITVHYQDEESFEIWNKDMGVPIERIVRCGDKDNFWAMGDTGPCGPCTEIFYDHGPTVAGGPPGSAESDGDRYMEIWNLVFMQYDRQSDGTLNLLPNPCVDTGMGLERLACVMEGVFSNFDTSLFRALKAPLADRLGIDISHPGLNVIADHLRSACFIIADGVFPSSDGRGYVLRRLIRRAVNHGYQLGLKAPFLSEYAHLVVELMGEAYPHLNKQLPLCQEKIRQEEQLFFQTLQAGRKYIDALVTSCVGHIHGDELFKLYDTYGFPLDIAIDIAKENGLSFDRDGFDAAMQKQKEQSKTAKTSLEITVSQLPDIQQEFVRDLARQDAKILAVFADTESDKSWLCFDRTPFYAQSGGQVGDHGEVHSAGGVSLILDTQKIHNFHLSLCDRPVSFWTDANHDVTLHLDTQRRHRIACHHTATHLLHAALHRCIGTHVQQKGSYVGPDRLRFDISLAQPLSTEQKADLEKFCQNAIDQQLTVQTHIMDQKEAIDSGAVAFFGDKYGAKVRVLSIGEQLSRELCGGTHVNNLSVLSTVVIVSDEPLAAGIRRLQALSGPAAIEWLKERSLLIHRLVNDAHCDASALVAYQTGLKNEVDALNKSLQSLQEEQWVAQIKCAPYRDLSDKTTFCCVMLSAEAKDRLTRLSDCGSQLLSSLKESDSLILALYVEQENKITLSLRHFGAENVHLKQVAQQLSNQFGWKGGGRSDRIQSGGAFLENFEDRLFEICQECLSLK